MGAGGSCFPLTCDRKVVSKLGGRDGQVQASQDIAREHQLLAQSRLERDDQGLDFWRYVGVLRRRFLYFVVPFVIIAAIGFALTMVLPAVYVAEGKLLVESQQIPTELVRPTITASAKERIQVIEQRIMTRENLLSIADKYQ